MLDSFERVEELKERKELHCVDCRRVTIHNLEARCRGGWEWSDGHNSVDGTQLYSIFRCGACDGVCYETQSWDSEDYDHDDDGNTITNVATQQYPAPVSAHFNFNTEATPHQLNSILDEMLYALAGSKMVLATMGLRLAVEFITKDKKCGGRNLQQKIDDLFKQELVDNDQRDLLHRIRERGNAGAHDAQGMTPKELIAGMAIIEGLLEKLYNGPPRVTRKRFKTLRRCSIRPLLWQFDNR